MGQVPLLLRCHLRTGFLALQHLVDARQPRLMSANEEAAEQANLHEAWVQRHQEQQQHRLSGGDSQERADQLACEAMVLQREIFLSEQAQQEPYESTRFITRDSIVFTMLLGTLAQRRRTQAMPDSDYVNEGVDDVGWHRGGIFGLLPLDLIMSIAECIGEAFCVPRYPVLDSCR